MLSENLIVKWKGQRSHGGGGVNITWTKGSLSCPKHWRIQLEYFHHALDSSLLPYWAHGAVGLREVRSATKRMEC